MKKLAMCAFMACAAFAAVAKESQKGGEKESRIWLPIGLSILTPPVQLPSPSHSVFGAMINLGYGQVDNLAILDLGIVNNVTDGMVGLELGAANLAGTCIGAQVGAVNIASRTVGVQLGVLNMTGDLHGLQLGVLNFSDSGGALVFPILNLGF
jgi:hypothetical protein